MLCNLKLEPASVAAFKGTTRGGKCVVTSRHQGNKSMSQGILNQLQQQQLYRRQTLLQK